MQVTRQTTVNVSADRVWQILGDDFNNVSQWASSVLDSHAIPDLPEGSGRVCHVKGMGEVVETIHHFDEHNRELAFILEGKKIPFFVQKIDNTWRDQPASNDRSVAEIGCAQLRSRLYR